MGEHLESTSLTQSSEAAFVSEYANVEAACKRYVQKLNKQLKKYKELFRDIDRMSRDKVLDNQTGIPTIFRD